MNTYRVRDLMTKDVSVIHGDADIHELEKLLLEQKIHGVPVVNGDGVLVGVISQTDLLAWHHDYGMDGGAYYDYSNLLVRDDEEFKGLRLADIQTATVEEVMSPMVHCIRSDRPITVAASTMIEKRIHRLIVVDPEYRVLGVISALDALRALPGMDTLLPAELALPQVDETRGEEASA